MLAELARRVEAGENLATDEMTAAIDEMMRGTAASEEVARLLTALQQKGESVAEIAGAARALRRHMTPIRTTRTGLIDTCGTGGDGSGTFNISTAAALVVAASGRPVAKHGNRSITSRSGSADVLAALGIRVEAPVATVEKCLDELGIGFCFAPLLHPAMRHVGPVRRQLGFPTIFNLLGPLCNPASAPYQLLGTGRADVREKLAAALGLLGIERGAVVRGEDGLDEVTLAARTQVSLVGRGTVAELSWSPTDFGATTSSLESLRVDGPEASAALIRTVLAGEPGPAREIVLVNAAAALWVANFEPELAGCYEAARAALDAKTPQRLLAEWSKLSQS